MKFTVVGSGGCVSLPRPLCRCPICAEAREKGAPYSRHGCSLYLHGANMLVDTPEDICGALNLTMPPAVDIISYSHWDPDHTLGMRVIEQLRLEWLDFYKNIYPEKPIEVLCHPDVLRDINAIRNPIGAYMDYYEHMKLIKRRAVKAFEAGGVKVALVEVSQKKAVSVYVFEENGKKLIYAPCDCKPFPNDTVLYGADVLLMGNTFPSDVLKGGEVIGARHQLRRELHSLEDAEKIRDDIGAKRLIITHLEEDWGLSYDDYRGMENERLSFAYDGMELTL